MNVLNEFDYANTHRFRQIDLVHHDELCPKKHVRMLPDHVRAFGNTHHNNPGLGPERELGRTDQIANVLNENQPKLLEIHLPERLSNQVCIQMATVYRRNLDHWNALAGDQFSV